MTTLLEMGRLQGFPTWIIEYLETMLSHKWPAKKIKRCVGHAIGNAMSVNVLCRLLPRVLVAAGLLHELQDVWKGLSNKGTKGFCQTAYILIPRIDSLLLVGHKALEQSTAN